MNIVTVRVKLVKEPRYRDRVAVLNWFNILLYFTLFDNVAIYNYFRRRRNSRP